MSSSSVIFGLYLCIISVSISHSVCRPTLHTSESTMNLSALMKNKIKHLCLISSSYDKNKEKKLEQILSLFKM